jgi:tetratricopeptide (TPR) repeat protein
LGAVSQVEALAQSQCKKQSGNSMSCISCHNPHQSVAAEVRVAFYRGKCLACHGAEFGTKHHPDHPDCTACHMPASDSTDVAHTEVTDHRILRRPQISPQFLENQDSNSLPRLVAFPESKTAPDARDIALAWDSIVQSGMSMAEPRARELLFKAVRQSPDDPALLSALAYDEQQRGAIARAKELYTKALGLDATLVDAATNLGVIEARAGELQDAMKLWQDAFQRAPARSGIGLNIARAYCSAGKFSEARNYVLRVLEFNPDLPAAKKLSQSLGKSPTSCGD